MNKPKTTKRVADELTAMRIAWAVDGNLLKVKVCERNSGEVELIVRETQ